MAMSAEDIAHPAYAYLDADITLIPITPGAKTPAIAWKAYQSRHSTPEEVAGWLQTEPRSNWAAVCGGGLACGDVDDLHASAWVLAHPNHPVLQGACIVRSGRGKCHVWFRYTTHLASTTWRLLPGRKMGEIRAEGNYVLVPPSALTGYEPYQRVAGSFVTLPTIVDPDRYLESIVAAYREDNPEQSGVEPTTSNKRVLILDAAQADAVVQRIRLVGFKKKILDTLFVQGHQEAGKTHWEKVDSNSEIDFAVCCEFIRKGWAFDDIEEVFASTLVGHACYRDTNRANHGQGYLFHTYGNAKKEIEAQIAAARQARGANFEVLEAVLLDMGDEKFYTLVMADPQGQRYTVRVNSAQLSEERAFARQCAAQARLFPRFNANQRGSSFSLFAEAVDRSVSEVTYPTSGFTDLGRITEAINYHLKHLRKLDDTPTQVGHASTLGWQIGNVRWFRSGLLMQRLITDKLIKSSGEGAQALRALRSIGEVQEEMKYWEDHEPESVTRVTLPLTSRRGLRSL